MLYYSTVSRENLSVGSGLGSGRVLPPFFEFLKNVCGASSERGEKREFISPRDDEVRCVSSFSAIDDLSFMASAQLQQ